MCVCVIGGGGGGGGEVVAAPWGGAGEWGARPS